MSDQITLSFLDDNFVVENPITNNQKMKADTDKQRIKELEAIILKADTVYYQKKDETLSNYEYDNLYEELLVLEDLYGASKTSPTQNVGYGEEIQSSLEKVRHKVPMLSLAKTKNIFELVGMLKKHEEAIFHLYQCISYGCLSLKYDGLTIVCHYKNGMLTDVISRGTNGEVGERLVAMLDGCKGLPRVLSGYNGDLVVRGEAYIDYKVFNQYNETLAEAGKEPYKNPRNLCSGTVRSLDKSIVVERGVRFAAFRLIEGYESDNYISCLDFMTKCGFDIIKYERVTSKTLETAVNKFEQEIREQGENYPPCDGLVLELCHIPYAKSLGKTSHHYLSGMAFKFADTAKKSTLKEIIWQTTRTGLIAPVALFNSIELENTSVSRATLHNVTEIRRLELGIGDEIEIIKSNLIIPRIVKNNTCSNNYELPTVCPCCGGAVILDTSNDTQVLRCDNIFCSAKLVRRLDYFAGNECMNIVGLSKETLELFVENGYVRDFVDIFNLSNYENEICSLQGFGLKSYQNLINAIETARHTSFIPFLCSLGIPNIAKDKAKKLNSVCCGSIDKLFEMISEDYDFTQIDGFGEVISNSLKLGMTEYLACDNFHLLIEKLDFKEYSISNDSTLKDMLFVITGDLNKFTNRKELVAYIEDRGGKVVGSVSSKTHYLINNDVSSDSGKNKAAKQLNIPIISEERFLEMANI